MGFNSCNSNKKKKRKIGKMNENMKIVFGIQYFVLFLPPFFFNRFMLFYVPSVGPGIKSATVKKSLNLDSLSYLSFLSSFAFFKIIVALSFPVLKCTMILLAVEFSVAPLLQKNNESKVKTSTSSGLYCSNSNIN